MKEINGLSSSEVKLRIKDGKVNYDTTAPSKSVKQILAENTFTLFNFINLILGVAIVLVGSYKNLLFLGVVVCNTLISTIQEIRAKKTVDKLSVISSSKARVIRDGNKKEIHINNIVLDDLVIYELGNQVVVDSKVVEGFCEVNESFITGEAKTIYKKEGDTLLSGSFIVSGTVKAKVIHVGLDNYTSVISHDAKKVKKEINSEIMRSLNKIVKYVSIALVPIGILLLLRQFSIDDNTTQNAVVTVVAAVVGMATALELATTNLQKTMQHEIRLRDKLIKGLIKIEHSAINGDLLNRLPNNFSICFEGIEGESLLLLLDDKGICASSGSACTSGSLDPSHVLLAIGRPHDVAHGSLRLTLSKFTTEAEIDYCLTVIPKIVEYLREISPVWDKLKKGEISYAL